MESPLAKVSWDTETPCQDCRHKQSGYPKGYCDVVTTVGLRYEALCGCYNLLHSVVIELMPVPPLQEVAIPLPLSHTVKSQDLMNEATLRGKILTHAIALSRAADAFAQAVSVRRSAAATIELSDVRDHLKAIRKLRRKEERTWSDAFATDMVPPLTRRCTTVIQNSGGQYCVLAEGHTGACKWELWVP